MWDDLTPLVGSSPQNQDGTTQRRMTSTPKAVPGETTPYTTPIVRPDVLPSLRTLRRTEIMTPDTPPMQRQLPVKDKVHQRALEHRLLQQQLDTGDARIPNIRDISPPVDLDTSPYQQATVSPPSFTLVSRLEDETPPSALALPTRPSLYLRPQKSFQFCPHASQLKCTIHFSGPLNKNDVEKKTNKCEKVQPPENC
jgi:hypothetical protein